MDTLYVVLCYVFGSIYNVQTGLKNIKSYERDGERDSIQFHAIIRGAVKYFP